MWFYIRLHPPRFWQAPLPFTGLPVNCTQCVPKRSASTRSAAELLGEFAEEITHTHVTARFGDLMLHHLRKSEVLEHRNEIRESFVKCQPIRLRHLHEAWMNAVQNGVSR